jgi:hypothetical protein
MYEKMAEREAAEEEQRADNAQRHRNAAQKKRSEAAAQLVRQSLREIYRKLASAVHPDRESDPRRRDEKNALMQRINQAYAANDLLSLFEIQIEIDQLDSDQIANLGAQRLRHYNRLLAEQLEQIRTKTRTIEASAGEEHGVEIDDGFSLHKLAPQIQRQVRRLRAEVTRQEQFLRVLADKAATRRWLKQQRQFARGDLDDDE